MAPGDLDRLVQGGHIRHADRDTLPTLATGRFDDDRAVLAEERLVGGVVGDHVTGRQGQPGG